MNSEKFKEVVARAAGQAAREKALRELMPGTELAGIFNYPSGGYASVHKMKDGRKYMRVFIKEAIEETPRIWAYPYEYIYRTREDFQAVLRYLDDTRDMAEIQKGISQPKPKLLPQPKRKSHAKKI